jgi:hypothetical protein
MAFGRRISNYFSIHLHNVQLIWTALHLSGLESRFEIPDSRLKTTNRILPAIALIHCRVQANARRQFFQTRLCQATLPEPTILANIALSIIAASPFVGVYYCRLPLPAIIE